MKYVWFATIDMLILIDMKEQKPIGSLIPNDDGSCIIRYGHHADSQPMIEDLITHDSGDITRCILKASGIVEINLRIPSLEIDDRAVIAYAAKCGEE